MRPWSMLAVTGLLVALVFSGCLGGAPESPVEQEFSAAGGKVSDGYAYDGVGVVTGEARLSGHTNREENSGLVRVTFEFAGSSWEVIHDAFAGEEDWKEGGVSFGLVEHGDTGVSTPIIPRIDGAVVTYGTASVLRDGEPARDPGGAEGPWQAHLMLSTSTIRASDGKITKADGTTPYDPATPGDARIVEDDPQAFFQLTAPSGADSARAPETVSETVAILGPGATQSVAIGGGAGAMVTVNLTVVPGDLPVQAGDMQFRLVDDAGNVLARGSASMSPGVATEPSLMGSIASPVDGPVTLEIAGNGTFQLQVEAGIVYDDHPFLIVTWDDYTLEAVDAADR